MRPMTRRSLLVAVPAALGSGLVWRFGRKSGVVPDARERRLATMLAGLSTPDAARRVGREVLRAVPAWRDEALLRDGLFVDLDASAATRTLADEVRADLAAWRVITVDGWTLSETEARVYAMAALRADPHAANESARQWSRRADRNR